MSKADLNCHTCGDTGHFASECPNEEIDAGGTYRDGTPRTPWCGFCNRRTRLIGRDEAHRCPACHPFRHQNLKQFRRCPSCHATVYEWDNAPCGHHVAPFAADKRPEREHIDAIVGAKGL